MSSLSVLGGHPLVHDVAVVTRVATDGRAYRVVYVVPETGTAPELARRTVSALAAADPDPLPVLVSTVSAIPRDRSGAPDEAELCRLPVPESADPRPARVPDPVPGRCHLGDVVDLPAPWAAGPVPSVPGVADGALAGPAARCGGAAPVVHDDDPATLVDALLATATSFPDRGIRVVHDGPDRFLSYPDLLHEARRTLTGLRAAGLAAGDPVILHSPGLTQHIVALWACLLGGFRPVAVARSATYEAPTAVLDKLTNAWRDLAEPVVLSGGAAVAGLRGYARRTGRAGMRVLDLAECVAGAPAAHFHRPAPDDVAMLQLSSGSTGRSKIIQMTHRGIVGYVQGAREASHMRAGDVFANWLPLDHVAGLVMYHLGPVVLGCDNVHAPTAAVLADPLLWLDLLQDFGVRHSWAPNFGYALVAEALAARPDRRWDLRGLRTLVNAGEQCTEPVMSRFLDAVRPHGVEDHTVLLAWGMAETATAITYQHYGPDAVQHVRQSTADQALELLDAPEPGATTFLSMGHAAPGAEFRIVGPDRRTELPELHIGRLQGRSGRITPGYLDDPEANAAAFPDGEWFDTGDLAFVAGGRVTITGRAKEVIIVNGVHYYCHEIEDVIGALDGVAQGFVAAFGVPGWDGVERVAVVFVPAEDLSGAVTGEVRRHTSEHFGLASVLVVAVDRESFQKTTSGKIQRTAMRERLLSGGFDRQVRAVELAESGPNTMPDCLLRPRWRARAFPTGHEPGRVLLVTDDPALGRALTDTTVAGTRQDDWAALLADPPATIVLAPGHTAGESTVDERLDACSTAVLALTTALAGAGWTGDLVTVGRGRYVVTGAEPAGHPAALTEAIGQALALEHPGVRCWHLDLPGGERDPELLADALTWSHRETVVAWRDVPMVRELRAVRPEPGPAAVPPGSCWLVTGGAGGIGRTILPDLGLRLLVVGRGAPRDLDELGADVRYARVDVADGAALEAAVAEAERAWGAGLTGAIHLAGQYELGLLDETPAARWRERTRAKVEGSLAVAEVLRRRPGTRLVAFSSALTWVPAAGSVAYVAGNRFLEALCEHLDLPAHCLVWGLWQGVGVSAAHDYGEAANRGRLLSFSPAEGRALLTAALRQPPGVLLIGLDPAEPRIRRMTRPARPLEGVREPGRDAFGVEIPVVAGERPAVVVTEHRDEPRAGGAVGVGTIVRDTVRRVVPGGIGHGTPFYEAGIGSLQLLRLHALLQEALRREFPLTALFQYPTEAALSRYLSEATGDGASASPPAPALDNRIAIIGMAARFPGADTLDGYWRDVLAGTVRTRRFDRAELLAAGLPESLVDDPDFVPVSGALADIAGFDAELFGISPGEAALTDPQQRLFLQICHEALEHGGYAGVTGRIGVFAGAGMNLYSLRGYQRARLGGIDPGDQLTALQAAIGTEADFLASRVAYRLGLTGPAVTVQTACSTSLVAVHTAVRALLAGDADLALAGAAALHVPQVLGYRYHEGSILSRTGACRAFDADADGTVGGNGVAAVLLKPLEAALADGDTVHAVILGSAVNNDGAAKVGFTAPSVSGQTAVVRDALATAGVDPASIGYVEAHGTGTPLGDPIEIEALRAVFGDRAEPLLVGSVKSNIGHLDSCAGMAGLLKTVLALRNGTVPPQPGPHTPNPALRLADGPIELPVTARPWPVPGPRRAGVTALGVGGTNAHVVLEEPPPAEPAARAGAPWVVPLSARGPVPLAELAGRLADTVATGSVSAADVLTTLGGGRRRLPHRLVAWGDTAAATATALRAGGGASGVAGEPGPVVFAFAGQGVDCTGAAAALMSHPSARETLRRCAEQHRRVWGVDLLEPLLGRTYEWTTATGQPALLALQLAQAALLDDLGVRPDVVTGHSAGEYAALCVAGALSLEDAMHLAAVRGALLQQRMPDGAMLAVFDDVDELPGLAPAVRNGPGHVVFAGSPAAVAAAEAELAGRGVGCRRLAVDRAFHTAAVEPVLDELARQAAGLDWRPLRLPVVTGLAGEVLLTGRVPGADHVRRHTREPADYRACVDRLTADGATTFVELGPAGVLTALGRHWPGTTWVPLRRRAADTVVPALAALWCHGVEVDWAALGGGRRVPLPTYPFQLTRHWVGDDTEPTTGATPGSDGTATLTGTVLARVRELTARQLGEEPARVGADVSFFDLGADSLLMITMVRELEVAFGVRVAMRELFEEVDTPARLAEVIVARMDPARRAEPAGAPHPVPASAPTVAATGTPALDEREAVVRAQLDLMGRLTRLMSEQLTVLSRDAAPAALPPPVAEPTQLGPRPTVRRDAGMTSGRLDERQRAHLTDLTDRYTARTATSKRIAQRYRRRLADSRAVVGFRGVTKELQYPIAARRAHGAYLEDVDGNTYVDITMGFGVLLFGHEPDFVTEAVAEHLADGIRLGARGPETGQVAELLCELTGLDRAAFATSGTEANSAAFRLARAHTGRTTIVTFDGSYHGHFDPVLGRTVTEHDRPRTVPVSPGIPDSAVADTMVLPYGEQASLDAIRRHADRIAAVVLEAVPSRHPDRQPVEFVHALRELCDRHGIVLVFDEMLTGFRPHPRGAQGFFGVRADLATYGKVIGGGYPIGAIAGRADIMDWVDGGFWSYGDDSVPAGDTTFFGGTYMQHPVSMVAARAVLTRLRDHGPELQRTLNARTDRLAATLNDFFAAEEFPVTAQHFGSLFRFAHRGNLELLFHHLVLAGVHVWEWRNFFLSTAHTDADVDFIADAVRDSLHDLRRGGFLPGRAAPRGTPTTTGGATADTVATTAAERQIWYLETVFPNRPAYNETTVVRLDGDLAVPALRTALTTVVTRHDRLRSVFREIGGEPRRVVLDAREVALPVREDPGATVAEAADRVVAAEADHAFDLRHGPLFEPWLVRLHETCHLLVLRVHHLVVDTWSLGILTEEIGACYRAALAGTAPDLPAPPPHRPPSRPPADLTYWTDLLAGAPRGLPLPTDRPRPAEPSGRGATTGLVLDEAVTGAVRELARRHRGTPFMVLFAAYAAALRRLSGRADLVIGTPFAHRPDGTERTVGFFVNTLPVRVRIRDDLSFGDLVLAVREQILGAQDHREVPFPEIVRALGERTGPARNPVFDVVVEYEREATVALDLPGVVATPVDATVGRAPLDLALFLTDRGDTIRCRLDHAVDLFDAATARRVLDTFGQVLAAGLAAPDRPLADLTALTASDAELLADWQHGGPAPEGPALLHADLSTVDNAAVVSGTEVLSRAALYRRAAAVTAAIGPTAGPVGVLLSRGADAVAAMLGVLRAGRAYVPLDPEQPPARLAAMLAAATTVLTTSALAGAVPPGPRTVLVDRLADEAPGAVAPTGPADVAYVVFTSGSTGAPKGCVVEHRAVANTIGWLVRDLGVTSADRLCWFSNPGFDASVIEVWPALRTGAALHVVPPDVRLDPVRLRDWLVGDAITVAFVPTPVCELLLDLDWPADVALRHLMTGGDRLRRRPSAATPFRLWNLYGPTEAAVAATFTTVSAHGEGPPPIGRPVPGTWVRVLDETGRQVPVGVPGELHLGGAQLARGYLDAPAETAARFVEVGAHGRLYRTGDVVRWRSDGELEFLRRDDSQVQIRGHRVEPGEVEVVLRGLPGVRDAAVRGVADPDGTASLAAYVVPEDPAVTAAALRAALRGRLPEHMVPPAWTVLPELPLTANGKLDRAALPDPAPPEPVRATAPATDTEQRLHDVWCAELGLPSASVEASFFELGGQSLTAVRVVNRIRTEFATTLGVLDFLTTPTIRAVAAHLDGAGAGRVEASEPASAGQTHAYWLTHRGDVPGVLTIATRFPLRGRLVPDALRTALTGLAARHPALRTRYRRDGDELWQEVLAPRPVALPAVPVTEDGVADAVAEWAARPFRLDHDVPLRAVLFTVAPDHAELVLAVHHGFSDGWSMAVLIGDLGELYRAALTATEPTLADLPADYLDFTRWERRHLAEPATRRSVAAWAATARRAGATPLTLPTDRPRTNRASRAGATLVTPLPAGLTEAVTAAAVERRTTPYAVVLAAFAAFTHELTGAPTSMPFCTAANRVDPRYDNVVGLFIHAAWLLVPVAGATSFDELVARATTAIHHRMDLQSIPATALGEALGAPFDTVSPRVFFLLADTPLPALELAELAPAPAKDVPLPVSIAEQTWELLPTDGGGLALHVEYATELFDAATVTSWTRRYLTLLDRSLTAPTTRTWSAPEG